MRFMPFDLAAPLRPAPAPGFRTRPPVVSVGQSRV